ncbi:UNVERIFIED_ORG: hypothetical protein M2355_001306 [Lelliottia amnigena]|nr:hypothetical protein [Lelliottia amnigena]
MSKPAYIPAHEELALIRECLVIDEKSPSGLRWVKPRARKLKPGDPAFTAKDRDGYYRGKLSGMNLTAHRVIFFLRNDVWPSGPIDHMDGCRTNNAPDNLREVTQAINCANRNGTGYTVTKSGTYQAQVKKDGKQYTKNFKDELSARTWYEAKKRELYPEIDRWQWSANEEEEQAA